MPQSLDLRALKQSARELSDARRKAAGWTAVFFFFVLFLLQLGCALLSDAVLSVPTFTTVEEMVLYYTDGHTNELLLMLLFELLPLLLSLLFSAVFSAYCLKLTRGQPAGGRTLGGSLYAAPRGFLLLVLLVVAMFAVSFVLSLLGLLAGNLVVLLLFAVSVLAIMLFYSLRLCLFSIADRKDAHILLALKDSAAMTKGYKFSLFILDLSFLWFFVILALISSACSFLPEAVSILAQNTGNEALLSWLTANAALITPACSLLSALVTMPLYYKFQTYIQLTYALAYQQLRQNPVSHTDTQPLAYQEFDVTDDHNTNNQ